MLLGCLVRYAVANTPYHFLDISEINAYIIWGVWCVTLSLTHPTIFHQSSEINAYVIGGFGVLRLGTTPYQVPSTNILFLCRGRNTIGHRIIGDPTVCPTSSDIRLTANLN